MRGGARRRRRAPRRRVPVARCAFVAAAGAGGAGGVGPVTLTSEVVGGRCVDFSQSPADDAGTVQCTATPCTDTGCTSATGADILLLTMQGPGGPFATPRKTTDATQYPLCFFTGGSPADLAAMPDVLPASADCSDNGANTGQWASAVEGGITNGPLYVRDQTDAGKVWKVFVESNKQSPPGITLHYALVADPPTAAPREPTAAPTSPPRRPPTAPPRPPPSSAPTAPPRATTPTPTKAPKSPTAPPTPAAAPPSAPPAASAPTAPPARVAPSPGPAAPTAYPTTYPNAPTVAGQAGAPALTATLPWWSSDEDDDASWPWDVDPWWESWVLWVFLGLLCLSCCNAWAWWEFVKKRPKQERVRFADVIDLDKRTLPWLAELDAPPQQQSAQPAAPLPTRYSEPLPLL